MIEVTLGTLAGLGTILAAVSAWLWMLGGRSIEELQNAGLAWFDQKSNRIFGRLIAPLFFSLSVIGISFLSHTFSYKLLLLIPAYLIISRLGHSTFPRRLFECICYALPLLLFLPDNKLTFVIQLLLSTLAAVIGHFNAEKKAPVIEFIVNFLRIFLVIFMVIK